MEKKDRKNEKKTKCKKLAVELLKAERCLLNINAQSQLIPIDFCWIFPRSLSRYKASKIDVILEESCHISSRDNNTKQVVTMRIKALNINPHKEGISARQTRGRNYVSVCK